MGEMLEIVGKGPGRAMGDGGEHLLAAGFGGFEHDVKLAAAGGGEQDRKGPAVGGARAAFDQAALLQEQQHRSDGVGVGGGAAGEFLLGDAILLGQARQQNELVRGDAVGREKGVGAAMHGPVGGAQGDCQFLAVGHRSPRVGRRFFGLPGGASDAWKIMPPADGLQRGSCGRPVGWVRGGGGKAEIRGAGRA